MTFPTLVRLCRNYSNMLRICYYSTIKSDACNEILRFLEENKIELQSCKDFECRHMLYFLSSSSRKEEIINELTFICCSSYTKILMIVTGDGILANDTLSAIYSLDFVSLIYWNEAKAKDLLIRHFEKWKSIDAILHGDYVRNNLIGKSPAWLKVLDGITEAALFSDLPILLYGESGTGKELLSRLIHQIRHKSSETFVLLDCTTIMPELWGSEFFGHEKGSFTGAIYNRDGAFALANNGTLFLDEVGELSPYLQSTLLRVIEENAYKKVGCNYYYKTNFRLVCATNKNLSHEVNEGSFRKDLYYRISAWEFQVPSLRERKDDIPSLIDYFSGSLVSKNKIKIDKTVYELLMKKDYPGNIRELKHLINRTMARFIGEGTVTLGDIPAADRISHSVPANEPEAGDIRQQITNALANGMSLQEIKESFGDIAMNIALGLESGNKKLAAERLQITRRALEKRLENGRNNKRSA